ncbi:u3 small nucleolar rna-associated protein 6 [Plasmopara halstedii]|uniref:U3 small nucleolar rna-associated protein 6 n=1 Tax=Plasmopara halstedii TaxID=4781 RepID=A0A0P1AR09_PLAHL|nr:u3 small nucleolar rna-associated protein 6 [Plasmopara halstedii]CEG43302.1 u3 small nucleolar rna-associated protein 6 [Plasmopara halstedii]|eukprot:XP_024579671.1 u3 small nucleolar rna-associated protein 6 [Plasmopara halstedii]
MADTVQITMEKMIPELEDLEARKIFTKHEIRQIVDKRRSFEYSLKRVPLRKIDAMRYIEYELQLDALRAMRKERLNLVKVTLGDTAGVKRVHNIFDRVLFKHRGSIELWLQYVAFCKREGSSRVLSAVFSRALQSNPRCAELWIEAASYEFGVNLNVDSARVLMQRAIRLNKENRKLWIEYFRLELLYVQKLTMRRQVLRLDDKTEKSLDEDGSTVLIDQLPEEQDDQVEKYSEEMTTKMNARKLILQGAIAKIVYTNAISAIPNDVSFRLEFVKIRDFFGSVMAAEVSDFILEDCLNNFLNSEEVHVSKALRPLLVIHGNTAVDVPETMGTCMSEAEREAEVTVVRNFEDSVAQLGTFLIKELFAEWILTRLASLSQTAFLLEHARVKLKEFALTKSSTSSLAIKYVDFIHRTDGTNEALLVVGEICDKWLPQSSEMWLLQSQLVLHADYNAKKPKDSSLTKRRRTSRNSRSRSAGSDNNSLVTAISILETALTKVAADDYEAQFAIYSRILQLHISNGGSSSVIEKLFTEALGHQKRGSVHWSNLRHQFVAWSASIASQRSLEHVRALYTRFMVDEQLLQSPETYSFLMLCVDIETSATSINVNKVRELFEKLIDLFGSTHEEVWVQYVRCLTERLALFGDAMRVQQRALRVWKESPALTHLASIGM